MFLGIAVSCSESTKRRETHFCGQIIAIIGLCFEVIYKIISRFNIDQFYIFLFCHLIPKQGNSKRMTLFQKLQICIYLLKFIRTIDQHNRNIFFYRKVSPNYQYHEEMNDRSHPTMVSRSKGEVLEIPKREDYLITLSFADD